MVSLEYGLLRAQEVRNDHHRPPPDGSRSHIDVTPEEFERRLAAHGHDADEIHHLWDELAAAEPEAPPAARRSAGSERLLGFGP